ncbi:DUF2510 domain-containing protein [Microbacterium sp. Marseille-Q6648]|uniref:DUF2510 domain-containing protein n=1 Tax=Microbacterium sp. Marseille-Q6648 TaxID=2937991 RepID=UPI00204144C4|nr:DUF2510 domain-containing protein [Microbacterium sp. Marseille-Q6648]
MTGTGAAPGWYDDGTGKQRWWDGARWTEQYIDLREQTIDLHTDAGPPSVAAAQAGWYDDQHGRSRWWNGRQWTDAVRYSGEEREFSGIVIDGRWIHFGEASQRVGEVQASHESGDALLRRPAFTRTAVARRLLGPAGLITPRTLNRVIARSQSYVVVSAPAQTWVAPVSAGQEAQARDFVAWVNASSAHYRFG